MSDEKFFSQVKNSLEFYAPEAPEAVYSGMRRKLWWSGFTKLSATRFNMWYLILLVGLGSGAVAYSNTCTAPATECNVSPLTPAVKPTEEAKVIPAVTEPTVVVTEPEVVNQPAVVTAPAQTAVVAPSTPKASRPKSTPSTSVVKPMDVPSSEPKAASSETTIVNTDAPVNPSTPEVQTAEPTKEETPKKKKKALPITIYSDSNKDSSEAEK